jgi:hypothetical protein
VISNWFQCGTGSGSSYGFDDQKWKNFTVETEKLSWIGSTLDQGFIPQTIELIIDGQTFLRTYDLAPRPTPPPSPVRKLDRRHIGRLRKRDKMVKEGGGEGLAKSLIVWPQESLVLYKSINKLSFFLWGYSVRKISQINRAKWPKKHSYFIETFVNMLCRVLLRIL